MAKLKINGAERDFTAGLPQTLAGLLEQLGIEAATVVAEIDGRIVEQKDFISAKLSAGQTIELVRFVPGG